MKIKSRLSTILLVLVLLVGVGVLVYPTFSDWWNQFHQSRAIATYDDAVDNLEDEQKKEMYEQAVTYNADLRKNAYMSELSEEEETEYRNVLDVSGTGIMGYIVIDKIHLELPIYHGTSEGVLEVAVGHMEGTSLVVGGESTHCVLSAHTGLPAAKLFTDIDKLEIGDNFQVIVLDRVMNYEVDQIRIVEPDDKQNLAVEDGQDYMTLETCTPYGVNTHRLLVRGHRTTTLPKTGSKKNMTVLPRTFAPKTGDIAICGLCLLAAAALIVFIYTYYRRGKTK